MKENIINNMLNNILEPNIDSYVLNDNYPTGFSTLDSMLGGGLYPGLYCIGGVSNLGKSVFCQQIMDNLIANKIHCIMFNLEVEDYSFITRDISRRTFIHTKKDIDLSVMSSSFNTKVAMNKLNAQQIEIYQLIIHEMLDVINIDKYLHTFSYNPDINYTIDIIIDLIINTLIELKSNAVVFIDYLQIISKISYNITDKEHIDIILTKLKSLSSKYKIPIILISSLNRQSYKEPISLESFKESGSIEYTSDVVIGLQFKGIGTKSFNLIDAKSKLPINLELIMLKQRNSYNKYIPKMDLNFYSNYGYFEEIIRQNKDDIDEYRKMLQAQGYISL